MGVHQRLMVLPSRQQGESYTLIKPGRLHLDVTGGEALGQNIALPPHPLLPGRQYPSVSWYCLPGSREKVTR